MLKKDGSKKAAGIVLEREVLEKLDRIAEINGRSRSYVVNVLLKAALRAWYGGEGDGEKAER